MKSNYIIEERLGNGQFKVLARPSTFQEGIAYLDKHANTLSNRIEFWFSTREQVNLLAWKDAVLK